MNGFEDPLPPWIDDPRAALLEGLRSAGRWLSAGAGRLGVVEYLLATPSQGTGSDWREVAPVPRAEQRYRPQGLVFADGKLWLTDHHRNRHSFLYRLDPDTGACQVQARMPDRARHPGGLAWDGTHLWAMDYVSATLFRIDPEATAATGRAQVLEAYDTGLPAASALTIAAIDGREHMVLSDYLWRLYVLPPVPDGTGRTYVVPVDRIPSLAERSIPELAVLSYDNGGFPQGLTWLDGRLLEAVNNAGLDRIEVLDVADAVRSGDPGRIGRGPTLAGPGWMIEDLATDGERLWTTDEGTYRLYVRDGAGI